MTLKPGLGSLKVIENYNIQFDTHDFLLTFYVVTMALSRVVSEIFNVEKRRDLEIGVRGHSSIWSLKVIESCTMR